LFIKSAIPRPKTNSKFSAIAKNNIVHLKGVKLVHKDRSNGNKTTQVSIIKVGISKTHGPFRNFLMMDLETYSSE